jgi:hypothetical protein
MTLRTDPSVQAMQHNARELAEQGVGLVSPTAVAGAGADQAGATALTTNQRVVATSGANTTGVRLPAGEMIGSEFTIYAPTANTINVYPPTGESIGAGAANAALAITAARGVIFRKLTATNWGVVRDA